MIRRAISQINDSATSLRYRYGRPAKAGRRWDWLCRPRVVPEGRAGATLGRERARGLKQSSPTETGHSRSVHRREGFQDEFRRLLEKYEVEYDERYVWD